MCPLLSLPTSPFSGGRPPSRAPPPASQSLLTATPTTSTTPGTYWRSESTIAGTAAILSSLQGGRGTDGHLSKSRGGMLEKGAGTLCSVEGVSSLRSLARASADHTACSSRVRDQSGSEPSEFTEGTGSRESKSAPCFLSFLPEWAPPRSVSSPLLSETASGGLRGSTAPQELPPPQLQDRFPCLPRLFRAGDSSCQIWSVPGISISGYE